MTTPLLNDLKVVIDGYLDGHRSRNLASLSRVSGVAYTTLRRFAQMEGHPTAEPVLKILDAALNTKDKIRFLEKHFPEIASAIAGYAKLDHSAGDSERELEKVFARRRPHCYIMNLAGNPGGTTADTVNRLYGELGNAALDDMVETGILIRERGGKVVQRHPTFLTFDPEYLLNQIRNSADIFDLSLVGTDAARMWHWASGVNAEGLRRINEVASKAFAEISAINEDPRYQGNIPCFAGLLMNVYDKQAMDQVED